MTNSIATRADDSYQTFLEAKATVAPLAGHTIEKLLSSIVSLGHRRSQGYGRAISWTVTPDDETTGTWKQWDGILRRPMPTSYGPRIGVKPPYHYRPWWTPATPAGAPT